jgi:arylsulfatase A-like enzyme
MKTSYYICSSIVSVILSLVSVSIIFAKQETGTWQMQGELLQRAISLQQSEIMELASESRELLYTLHEKTHSIIEEIPDKAILDTAFGIDALISRAYIGTIDFHISITTQNKKRKILFHKSFDISKLKAGDFQWHPVSIDLAEYYGQKVTITFNKDCSSYDTLQGQEIYDLSPTDFAFWARPQIRPKTLKDKVNVILISLDALRNDHLHFMGYRRQTSPNIDEFVKKGCFFSTVVSQAPWTTPAHFSIFTSTYPRINKGNQPVQITNRRWNKKIPTLASILREKGYLTAAFTGRGSISAKFGLYKGFDFYNETENRDIKHVFKKAVNWLHENKDRTFFLFFHTYQIHSPYTNKHFLNRENINPKNTIEYRKVLYDGDIWFADGYMGKLFSEIEALNLMENTLIILTSDHGEDLGGRNPPEARLQKGHGYNLYDELLLVPLILAGPQIPSLQKGIDHQIRSIDIAPTIIEYLGFKQKSTFQGTTLKPMIEGKDQKSRLAFSEATSYGTERESVRFKGYKYIHRLSYGQLALPICEGLTLTPLHELYDLKVDPQERNNIAQDNKKIVDEYLGYIGKLFKAQPPEINDESEPEGIDISTDNNLMDALKSLGYIQ